MKLPKIKIKKLSKKAKLGILQGACVVVYSLGASLYGYFSYRAGQEDEWEHISSAADENGSVIFHEGDLESRDNMYWVAGREASKEIWDVIHKNNDDEQENS